MYWQNFKQYWKEHLVHLSVGGLAGALAVNLETAPAGFILMGTVWVRQGLEFAKRQDTPGIDLAYHLAGLLVGVLVHLGIRGGLH